MSAAKKKAAKKRTTAAKKKRDKRKVYSKIGEVCELTETEPYLLRYWEQEFPFLAPEKNKSGHRIYTEDDIKTVLEIKRLLYEEGYTTAGARRRLEKEREEGGPAAAVETAAPEAGSSSDLEAVNAELRSLLRDLRDELKALRAQIAESLDAPVDVSPRPRARSARKRVTRQRKR
ncbi:MAG: MerR family transcriptional regulator [Acidobacteriota bacterium]